MSSPDTGPALDPGRRPSLFFSVGGPYFALVVLFSMNLLNYVDRYVFFSPGRRSPGAAASATSSSAALSVSFMVVYTIVSPLDGLAGRPLQPPEAALRSAWRSGAWRRSGRRSRGFDDMFFWRALLGIGEASYGIIAPALLADLFPPKHRGRVMGLYYLALPLGGAIGYGDRRLVRQASDWRHAFWVVGIPGLVAAVAGLLIRDPGRGASEGQGARQGRPARGWPITSRSSGRRASSTTPPAWPR